MSQLFGTFLRKKKTPMFCRSGTYTAEKGGVAMKQVQYAKLTEIKKQDETVNEEFLRHLKVCLLQILLRDLQK